MTQQEKPTGKQRPKYRLTHIAYIDDRIYDPEAQSIDPMSEEGEKRPLYVEFDGKPGWHMEPVNDAARAMCEKYPPVKGDMDLAFNIMPETGKETTTGA